MTHAADLLDRAARRTTGLIARLESAAVLDRIVSPVSAFVNRVLPDGRLRDALHGVPIGHPAHPALVQVPLGAWLSVVVLDRMRGTDRAATVLTALGTAAAAPAAVTGIVDWAKGHEEQMRVGVVHWAANAFAVGCFAVSFVQRARGRTSSGKRLAVLGIGVAAAGGYLGGHMAYRQALGANHVEGVPHVFPPGWHAAGTLDDLPMRTPRRRTVRATGVLLYRDDDGVVALADECSHLSGPLHEGEVVADARAGACIECPWHGSVFALRDGSVVHGPATSPQTRFRTRVRDGRIEISLDD